RPRRACVRQRTGERVAVLATFLPQRGCGLRVAGGARQLPAAGAVAGGTGAVAHLGGQREVDVGPVAFLVDASEARAGPGRAAGAARLERRDRARDVACLLAQPSIAGLR